MMAWFKRKFYAPWTSVKADFDCGVLCMAWYLTNRKRHDVKGVEFVVRYKGVATHMMLVCKDGNDKDAYLEIDRRGYAWETKLSQKQIDKIFYRGVEFPVWLYINKYEFKEAALKGINARQGEQ